MSNQTACAAVEGNSGKDVHNIYALCNKDPYLGYMMLSNSEYPSWKLIVMPY